VIAAGAVMLIAVMVSLPYIYGRLKDYITRDTDKSAFDESGRSALFSRAWNEYVDSPIVGQGMGNFAREGVSSGILTKRETGNYPHNIILEVMCELGSIGLILFVIALRPGRHFWRIGNIYQILFIVYLIFSMTSGNIAANAGVMVFGALARLAAKYPLSSVAISEKKYPVNNEINKQMAR
jgi:O-antigen ligase